MIARASFPIPELVIGPDFDFFQPFADIAAQNEGEISIFPLGVLVGDEIRKIAIPMYGRMMHSLEGDLTYQQYGKEGQAIFSVSRGKINATMMDIAETHGNAKIHYQTECLRVDLKNAVAYLRNTETGQEFEAKADVIAAIGRLRRLFQIGPRELGQIIGAV